MINTIRNFFTSLLAPKHRAEGIDGSHWWVVSIREGSHIDFIILKATQGRHDDSALIPNMTGDADRCPRLHHPNRSRSRLAQADHFWCILLNAYLSSGCDSLQ
jgi:hypothetical protein